MFDKADNSDDVRLEQFKSDIKELQSKGVIVKLAYGGEEWGNSDISSKVCTILKNSSFCLRKCTNILKIIGR